MVLNMVLKEDEDMKRIYEGKYPNQIIYPTAFIKGVEHTVIIYLATAVVGNDKQGHENQNVDVEADIKHLETDAGIITQGRYILVFPRKSFYFMMKEAGVQLAGNSDTYLIKFKKKNKKCYKATYTSNRTLDNFGEGRSAF